MILNIIDNRKRRHCWSCIDAVIEPTWHDNRVKGADQAPKGDPELEGMGYEEITGVRLPRALEWGNGFAYESTIYLYDAGALARGQKLRRASLPPDKETI